jgi:hypothetical protein
MKFAYVTAVLFCLCGQVAAADNEGFALGTSAAAAYRNPNNVRDAGKGFETSVDRNDTDLQALVSQPIQSPAQHGVQNPVVLEPKKPWTQAQRDQFANMTQGQGVYDMACTQALKDALAAQGFQINCRVTPSVGPGYCQGDECTGD